MEKTLHESTFQYLQPTEAQIKEMTLIRDGFRDFVGLLDESLPPGADKTYIIRKVREAAMWANVAITRQADGTPR